MMFAPRPKGLGKDNFLKLNDKEEVTGIFRGEIYSFKRHWIQATMRSVECTGTPCVICKETPENRPAFRFRVNFVTNKGDQWFAKIFEGGGELYDSLGAKDKKFGLSKTIVDIVRVGTKQNTKYEVTPRLDIPLTKELEAKIGSVALLPMSVAEEESAAS